MLNISPDYNPKILHVGIDPSRETDNGIIYRPEKVYSKLNRLSEKIYEEFFTDGNEVVVFPIRTEQGPGELVKMLEKEFGIKNGMYIGGVVAPFTATSEQARVIIKELRKNPKKYFVSGEKEKFG